jgi:DNA-directed RNA polymerase subunit F
MLTTCTDAYETNDSNLRQHGDQFAKLDAARQQETNGNIIALTDQWWSVAGQIADQQPNTPAGPQIQLRVLRRIIEDSYLTDECHADALVRRLLENIATASLLNQ